MSENSIALEKKNFSVYYEHERSNFANIARSAENLIKNILPDSDFGTVIVTSRVKTLESCLDKLDRKYLKRIEEGETLKNLITDIIGVRVVCLYSIYIDEIIKKISENMTIVEHTDKISALDEEEAIFGYRAHHVRAKLNESRDQLEEYRMWNGQEIEIQVRTLVQDAWSTIDHKIRYKKEVPVRLKRRVARLAALFELADEEFLNISNMSDELEQNPRPDIILAPHNLEATVFDLLKVVRENIPSAKIAGYRLDEVLESIRRKVGEVTLEDVEKAGAKLEEAFNRITPEEIGTRGIRDDRIVIRVAFWLSNKNKFSHVITKDIKDILKN